jgi:hypothetical protein
MSSEESLAIELSWTELTSRRTEYKSTSPTIRVLLCFIRCHENVFLGSRWLAIDFRVCSLLRECVFGKPLASNGLRLWLHYSGSQASYHTLSRVRVSMTNNIGFWIAWLDLLTPCTINSNFQSIQRYRWFTKFTVHRYTRTRILSLH